MYENLKESNEIMEVLDVSFRHKRTDNYSIRKVDFKIYTNSVLGIAGLNGAGKTTLLKLIRGIIKPEHGEIKFAQNLTNHKVPRKNMVGYLTQEPTDLLFPTMTVFENYVASVSKIGQLGFAYSKKLRKSCNKMLMEAGEVLNNTIDKQVRHLSGGQQQTLAVLLSVTTTDSLLLMDEPTASLDILTSDSIIKLAISKIKNKSGAIILTSHRLEDLTKYADKILIMNLGQVCATIDNSGYNLSSKELSDKIISCSY